ncbi:histidine kinase [hydrothermal vent metagenome]|uniref:Histidine kinase n=1 Tax=hydrothermal vent metagenome TaxID=652676 RepID=A0A1W1EJ46_9ZZZZ
MKTINIKYHNISDLLKTIKDNDILSYSNILVQVFIVNSSYNDIELLINNISTYIPQAKILGTSSSTTIINSEAYENTILSISLFNTTQIETFIEYSEGDSYQLGLNLANQFKDFDNSKVLISFADGLNTNGEDFLNALNSLNTIPIFGGLASDTDKFNDTFVFTKDGITCNGAVSALLYGDDLIVNSFYNFGWEAIGKELVVTKSIKNRVYEIDNMPVLKVYNKYLGSRIENLLPKTAVEFPLILKKDGVSLGRAVIKKHSDNSLSFAGNIEEGSIVQFGYGDIEKIIKIKYDNIHRVLDYPVESIFIYSCMARLKLFEGNITKDIEPYNQISSVSGFFTFGEFFSNLDKSFFFNETKTLLFLSEKSRKYTKIDFQKIDINDMVNTMDALVHLNIQTVKELKELNRTLEQKVEDTVRELRLKDNMLLQQSKMAQMGELLEMISHQWKQPLTAIATNNANLLLRSQLETLNKDYLEERLNEANEYIGYLSDTINDFKDFFQTNKVKTKINFNIIMKNVKKIIYQNLLYNSIELKINFIEEDIIDFYSYANEIQQVVLNIITNAQDAIIKNNIKKGFIEVDILSDEEYFILTIEDNGGGIDSSIKDKILSSYFTTKKNNGGRGLGLYISNMIMQRLNGKLEYYNASNGAKFLIYIPR